MAQPIIQIEHLVKQFRKLDEPSVNDTSFSVEAGELFAFRCPFTRSSQAR